MARAPLLIAGGGIGGLALALALARRGITPVVVERAEKLAEIGAGLQLSPNVSRVLEGLGLGPELDKAGVRPESIRFHDGRTGAELAHMPLGKTAERRWRAPYRTIHRAALHGILADAVKQAGVKIRLDAPLTGFNEKKTGLTVKAGGEDIEARGLIGADGINSVVRRRRGGARTFAGQIAWRAMCETGNVKPEIRVWLGPGAHLVSYPVDGTGRVNTVAVTQGEEGAAYTPERARAFINEAYSGWAPQARHILEAAEDWLYWPLYEGSFSRGTGLVTLMGDAAHPILPHLAQGAALAIEDGAVLAGQIAASPDDIANAFRQYEDRRLRRVITVQIQARRNGTLFRLPGPLGFARNTALRLMGEERLLARMDWLYGYRLP